VPVWALSTTSGSRSQEDVPRNPKTDGRQHIATELPCRGPEAESVPQPEDVYWIGGRVAMRRCLQRVSDTPFTALPGTTLHNDMPLERSQKGNSSRRNILRKLIEVHVTLDVCSDEEYDVIGAMRLFEPHMQLLYAVVFAPSDMTK